MQLRDYQARAVDGVRKHYANGEKRVLLHLATGAGKCHGAGTKILMFDGSIKAVEDIVVGDRLMGDDSTPRTVKSLARGREEMFEVKPIKGEPWTCNRSHMLSLVNSESGEITNISIDDFFKRNKDFKRLSKLYRTHVEFGPADVPFDPYVVGIYLAEGWIPKECLINSRKIRLEVLAGLLDGGGYLGNNGYEFCTKRKTLCDDVLFLCRSLGFAAYCSSKTVKEKIYWRVSISGNVDQIPCKVIRKKALPRRQIKNVLQTGFKLRSLGEGDYFGFQLDGNHLYLLGDFTVTHNTICFSYMLAQAADRGRRAIMVVRGKELVNQASRRLSESGIHNHGVMQGNHWNYRPNAPIQICSIDTLRARGIYPDADFVVIDECHYAGSKSFRHFINQYPEAYILSVSATPHVKGGMGFLASKVVYPISIEDLIKQGYLVRPRYFAVPNEIDRDALKIDSKTGDYTNKSAGEAVEKAHICGDAIKHYKNYGESRAAIYFAVSVEASQKACRDFNAAGVLAAHIDAKTPQADRDEIIASLTSGKIKVVANCGVLTTGVDIPCLGAIILARPTNSYNLFVQMLGRGTRPYENKNDFLVFDHAGNIDDHGFIEHERRCSLEGKEPQETKVKTVTCEKCYAVFEPIKSNYVCRSIMNGAICGHDNTPKRNENKKNREIFEDKTIELVEIKKIDKFYGAKNIIDRSIELIAAKNYRAGRLYYILQKKYGEQDGAAIWAKNKKYIYDRLAKKGWTEPPKVARSTRATDSAGVVSDGNL